MSKKTNKQQVLEVLGAEKVYVESINNSPTFSTDYAPAFRVKSSYFYRMGRTAQTFADQIAACDPRIEIVTRRDFWRQWPQDSYFEVVFRFYSTREDKAAFELEQDIASARIFNNRFKALIGALGYEEALQSMGHWAGMNSPLFMALQGGSK